MFLTLASMATMHAFIATAIVFISATASATIELQLSRVMNT